MTLSLRENNCLIDQYGFRYRPHVINNFGTAVALKKLGEKGDES